MTQIIKAKFYKKIKEFYLFKYLEYFDSDNKWHLCWIGAYRDMKRSEGSFVCESGAGISQKRMENQIEKYFERVS